MTLITGGFDGGIGYILTNRDNKMKPASSEFTFTIFIPTYNRAYELDATFKSIERLMYKDFEVLIVDDGSTDGTRELVESWRSKVHFPVKYVYKSNGGKCSAHNVALKHASGFLFFPVDAGDLVLPEALNEIKSKWENIPVDARENFAGICGLCLKDDGSISGAPFARDIIDSDFNEIYSRSVMKSEKRWAVRLSVYKKYPYPTFDGEKYIRPTLVLRRISHEYKLRFINVPLQIERQESDGIRSNEFWHNYNSPKGQRLYFLEEVTLNDRYHGLKKQYRLHVHYVRYSLHAGVGILSQFKEVKHRFFWILAVSRGVVKWRKDLVKARESQHQ
jgi:glycosyltransferase involved in cell wall biosynthesis